MNCELRRGKGSASTLYIVDECEVLQLHCGMSYCGTLTSIYSIVLMQASIPVLNTWVIWELQLFMSWCYPYLCAGIYSSFSFSSGLRCSYHPHHLWCCAGMGRRRAESRENEKDQEGKRKHSSPSTVGVSQVEISAIARPVVLSSRNVCLCARSLHSHVRTLQVMTRVWQ